MWKGSFHVDRDSASIHDTFAARGGLSTGTANLRPMHHSGMNFHLMRDRTESGVNFESGKPFANERKSKYGAVTSHWNGSEMNDGGAENEVVILEQSEGEDFLVGS